MPEIVERRGNSEEQIRDYLAETLMIFNSFDIPSDLRECAFLKIFDLVAAKTLHAEPTPQDLLLMGRG